MKSNKKQPIYTPEFRRSAVKLAIEGDQSRAATARELGINVNTLHGWVSKHGEALGKTSGASSERSLEDQLKALKKENQRLKEERDILKKAAAYFASHSS
jgi:transposase